MTPTESQAADWPNPVPMKVVQCVPERMKTLTPGMTEEAVFRTLGLWEYRRHLGGDGGGPFNWFWTIYPLREDYNLMLVFDITHPKHPVFREASLCGKGWTRRE